MRIKSARSEEASAGNSGDVLCRHGCSYEPSELPRAYAAGRTQACTQIGQKLSLAAAADERQHPWNDLERKPRRGLEGFEVKRRAPKQCHPMRR